MALNALTLAVTTGVQGYPFRAALTGLTAGTTVTLGSDTAVIGGGVLNGVLDHPALPFDGANTFVAIERAPSGETRTTRLEATGVSRRSAFATGDASLSPGRTAVARRIVGTRQVDGSLVWTVAVTDDLGAEIVTQLAAGGGTGDQGTTPTTYNAALPIPEITVTSVFGARPLTIGIVIPGGFDPADRVEVRAATTKPLLLAGTYVGGARRIWGSGDSGTLDFGLAALTNPVLVLYSRTIVGDEYGPWSPVVVDGAVAPTFTNSLTMSSPENQDAVMNLTSTAGTPSYSRPGGEDTALFSLAGAALKLDHLLFTGSGQIINFEAPQDADTNNSYRCPLLVEDLDTGLVSLPVVAVVGVTNVAETAPLTFSTVDRNPYTILTEGNRRLGANSGTGEDMGARSSEPIKVQDGYCELTFPSLSDSVSFVIGFLDGATNLGNGANAGTPDYTPYPGWNHANPAISAPASDKGGASVISTSYSDTRNNGSLTDTTTALQGNGPATIGVIFDDVTKRWDIRRTSGAFRFSYDAVANTGGLTLPGGISDFFLMVSVKPNAANNFTVKINGGQDAWVLGLPTGAQPMGA